MVKLQLETLLDTTGVKVTARDHRKLRCRTSELEGLDNIAYQAMWTHVHWSRFQKTLPQRRFFDGESSIQLHTLFRDTSAPTHTYSPV